MILLSEMIEFRDDFDMFFLFSMHHFIFFMTIKMIVIFDMIRGKSPQFRNEGQE